LVGGLRVPRQTAQPRYSERSLSVIVVPFNALTPVVSI
jgi:hypothetical protein